MARLVQIILWHNSILYRVGMAHWSYVVRPYHPLALPDSQAATRRSAPLCVLLARLVCVYWLTARVPAIAPPLATHPYAPMNYSEIMCGDVKHSLYTQRPVIYFTTNISWHCTYNCLLFRRTDALSCCIFISIMLYNLLFTYSEFLRRGETVLRKTATDSYSNYFIMVHHFVLDFHFSLPQTLKFNLRK